MSNGEMVYDAGIAAQIDELAGYGNVRAAEAEYANYVQAVQTAEQVSGDQLTVSYPEYRSPSTSLGPLSPALTIGQGLATGGALGGVLTAAGLTPVGSKIMGGIAAVEGIGGLGIGGSAAGSALASKLTPKQASAMQTFSWTSVASMVQSGNIVGAAKMIIGAFGKNKFLLIIGAAVALGLISLAVYNLLKNSSAAKAARRRRRYTIGANPRLRTLIKVSRHTNKITKQFLNTARHAGLIRIPHRTQYRRLK